MSDISDCAEGCVISYSKRDKDQRHADGYLYVMEKRVEGDQTTLVGVDLGKENYGKRIKITPGTNGIEYLGCNVTGIPPDELKALLAKGADVMTIITKYQVHATYSSQSQMQERGKGLLGRLFRR